MLFLASAFFGVVALGRSTKWIHDTPDVNLGNWGAWHQYACPDGMLAKGFWYRFEAHIDGDDTAGNAVQLCCVTDINDAAYANKCEKSIGNSGNWGDWTLHNCPTGSFMNGYRQRIESNQGSGDDTAHNGLEVSCSDGTTQKYNGIWGDWSDMVSCPPEWFVTGLWVQYEDPVNGDDTALNNVWFQCSSPSIGKFRGHWEIYKSHNEGLTQEIETSITNSHGTAETQEQTNSIEVSAGVSAELYGIGFSYDVSAGSTELISKTAERGLEKGFTAKTTLPCGDKVGREAIYQWVLDSEYEHGGEGLIFHTDHTSCNPTRFPPICEPQTCHDDLCRDCCNDFHCGAFESPEDVLNGWTQCAVEGGTCNCKGEVRYGHTSPHEQWSNVFRTDTSIKCDNQQFGDPFPFVFKMCQCRKASRREVVEEAPAVASWAVVAGAAIALTAAGVACYKMKADGKYADIGDVVEA